jgi:hypothetical protein
MSVEAIVDHPSVHQNTLGEKVGRCKGEVIRVEKNFAVAIKTNPSHEICSYCTLQRYCSQSMAGSNED